MSSFPLLASLAVAGFGAGALLASAPGLYAACRVAVLPADAAPGLILSAALAAFSASAAWRLSLALGLRLLATR